MFLFLQTVCILRAGEVFFRHVGMQEGLPQMSVNAICQDEKGMMWFATREGLACYNGRITRIFTPDPSDSSSLASPIVTRLCADRMGRIYIGTTTSLSCFSTRRQRMRTVWKSVVHALCPDSAGLWFVSGGVLYRYRSDADHDSVQRMLVLGRTDGQPCCLTFHGEELLLGTEAGAVYRISLRQPSIMPWLSLGSHISQIFEDSRHVLWIGTWADGLTRVSADGTEHYTKTNGISSSFVRSIAEDGAHRIWLGTDDGIEMFDPSAVSPVRYLQGNSVWPMTIDRDGNLWIGTYFSGVFFGNPGIDTYTSLPVTSGRFPVISSIREATDGRFLLCTEGEGLWLYDPTVCAVVRRWSVPNIKASCWSSDGKVLWLGTHLGGLCSLDYRSGLIRHYAMPRAALSGSNVVRALQWLGDTLLVGTYGGVYCLDPGADTLRVLFPVLQQRLPYVVTMVLDHNRRLWIAGDDMGCFDLDADTFCLVRKPFRSVESLCLDHSGLLWIGTDGQGVWSMSPADGQFAEYSSRTSGLQCDFIRRLTLSPEGQLLIITTRGFSLLNTDTRTLRNYPPGLALPLSSLYNGGVCCTRSGDILLAGMDGLIRFREDDLPSADRHPEIVLDQLTVNSREILPGDDSRILRSAISYTDTITLRHSQKSLYLRFYLSDYALEGEGDHLVRYHVERKGYEWVYPVSPDEGIRLMNLPDGSNRLVIQVLDRDNESVLSERTLVIRMKAPWWRSAVAIILYIVLILTAIILLVLWEQRRVARVISSQQSERSAKMREDVLAFIDAHLAESDLDVSALCREMGLSRTRCFQVIKSLFNTTPQHLIEDTRLSRAALWLETQSDKNISDIAYDLGYQSPKYFSRCFKERYGVTPTQYRKQKTEQ